MIEVKETISILCKCLHDTIDSPLIPENFRVAKYDKSESDVMNAFWTTLDKLSYFALKELNDEIHYCKLEKTLRTRLRMAFLQYPVTEFFGLSETASNSGSRILLIALVWLITEYNVLKNIVRLKIIDSSLGREFSKVNFEKAKSSNDVDLSTIDTQINNLLHKSHKLSCNLKAISELHMEKVKLTTRVHAASLTTCGLPHLSVSEMSLVKKLVTDNLSNKQELEQLKEMEQTASMLDSYMKWTKTNHVFYTWMNTVIDESEKEELVSTNETLTELSKFICFLRFFIRKKIKSFKYKNDDSTIVIQPSCPSRLLRAQKDFKEIQEVLAESTEKMVIVDKNLEETRSVLETQLQSIFKLLPNYYQI